MGCCILFYYNNPASGALAPCTGHPGSASSSAREDSDTSGPPPSCFTSPVETVQKRINDSERVNKTPFPPSRPQQLGHSPGMGETGLNLLL